MDVAALGLEVQSADVVKATGDLNKLSVAAAQAEANAAKLSKQRLTAEGTNAAARAAQNLAKANELAAKSAGNLSREEMELLRAARQTANAHTAGTRAALERARAEDILAASQAKAAQAALREAQAQKRLDDARRPGNDNIRPGDSPGATRANNANIIAQFQDIGVTAAMGMNPLTIALQQGTQLSAVLASMEKPLAGLAAGFAGLFSAISLGTIAIIAIVAALLQFVNWTKVAQTVLRGLADIMPELALGIAAVGAALVIAFAPQIAVAIWAIASALVMGLINAILLIVTTIGAIPILIGAVIASFFIFRDEITKILGVDIVGSAKIGVNYIIGSFVAAYHDIEFLWKKFPDVIGAAAIGAANLAIGAVNSIVSTTLGAINGLIQAVNKIGSVGEYLGIGTFKIDEIDANQFNFDQIANTAADRLAGAVGDRNKQLQEDLAKDYLGTIGGAIEKGATWAADKLNKYADTLGLDKKKKKSGGKTEEEKYEDIIKGAERRIATLQAEYDAIGLTQEATARLKFETELLNQAQQKGITLTSAQKEELSNLAGQMATLEEKTRLAKEQFEFAKSTTRGFLGDLKQGLLDGKSLWESFGDAAMNVLDKIVNKLLDDLVDALMQVGSAGKGGGGGFLSSLFSGLFGGGAGGFASLPMTGPVPTPRPFAKGGTFTNSIVSSPTLFKFAKGTGMMGEAGPEAIMPLSRDSNGRLGVTMTGGGTSSSTSATGGSSSVKISLAPGLEASILEQAGNQTIEIVKENNKAKDELYRNGNPR